MLDGVFAEDGVGALRFHETRPPTDVEMNAVLGVTVGRLQRLLIRRGVRDEADGDGGHDPCRGAVLAGIAAASVQSPVALGPRAGPAPARSSSILVTHDRPPSLGITAYFGLECAPCVLLAQSGWNRVSVSRTSRRSPMPLQVAPAPERYATAAGELLLEARVCLPGQTAIIERFT